MRPKQISHIYQEWTGQETTVLEGKTQNSILIWDVSYIETLDRTNFQLSGMTSFHALFRSSTLKVVEVRDKTDIAQSPLLSCNLIGPHM